MNGKELSKVYMKAVMSALLLITFAQVNYVFAQGITLEKPENGSLVTNTNCITFSWSEKSIQELQKERKKSNSGKLRLEISSSPDFPKGKVTLRLRIRKQQDSITLRRRSAIRKIISMAASNPDGSVYWRVVTRDKGRNSISSDTSVFQLPLNSGIELLYPEDGARKRFPAYLSFVWLSTGVEKQTLYIGPDQNLGKGTVRFKHKGCQNVVTIMGSKLDKKIVCLAAENNNTLYWQIKGRNPTTKAEVKSETRMLLINPPNQAPIANAGDDQTVRVGQLVTLNGDGSTDPDGDPLTYQWSFVSRPPTSTATLLNPTSVNPSFTPDVADNYVIQLIVNDGFKDSAPDTVTISVTEWAVTGEVRTIINNKCQRCHTAAPADHATTHPDSVYECGLCHIPRPDGHYTAGCPTCHTTAAMSGGETNTVPEATHTYLRDDADQTVLSGDAEAKCISCHVDDAQSNIGAGLPPLDTDSEIVAVARRGTLRQWIQPGGFMEKYLTDAEATTIINWIDGYAATRELSYDPYLNAVRTATDFDIDGMGTNSAWSAATEHVVNLTPSPPFTSTSQVKLKALYTDNYLYIRAEYPDPNLSMTRSGSWKYNTGDGTWSHPTAATENDKQSEDRVSFWWNMSVPDYKTTYGCAIKCHGNVPGSSEYTDVANTKIDIWHSKAARCLGTIGGTQVGPLTISTANDSYEVTSGQVTLQGYCDDKYIIWYMDVADGYGTEDSGRRGDPGTSTYSHNRNATKSAPKRMETAPVDWVDAMVLTQAEIDGGETIIADPDDVGFAGDAAVANAWAAYNALEAVVPERILRIPSGSRGDILHSATWNNGTWVHEFKRRLLTSDPDNDVQFNPSESQDYEFSIAIFDNCGRGEIPPGHTTYGDGQYQILHFPESFVPNSP